MIRRLEDFARQLGAELQAAQVASQRAWPGTRIASMDVDLDTMLVRVGEGPKAFGLRVAPPRSNKKDCHKLTIQLSGERADDIEILLNGKLLRRYGMNGNGEKN
ncbi:MAG: hypothetical protein H7Z12_00950 [Rhodospirillaceae bacterium]|nr:hypothetical protein [Rhodospirillales bacterium]